MTDPAELASLKVRMKIHLDSEQQIIADLDRANLSKEEVEEFMRDLYGHPYAKEGLRVFPELQEAIDKAGARMRPPP